MTILVSIAGTEIFEATANNDPNFLTWTISLSEPAVGDVTVEYRFLAGTAVIGDGTGRDAYAFSSGTSVTFAAGEQSKTVQYRIESDNTDEADETVVLEVYGADGAELAGGAPVLRATGWILDDDGSGNNLALYVSDPVLVEGDSGQRLARFEVSLSRPATAAFEVDYTTLDGTATAGEDYQAQSDTLSFAVGQQGPVAIDVPVFGDTEVEPSELFTLSVDKPAELAAATSGSAAILDDDAGGGQPTVSVSDTAQMEATANNDPNFLTWTISLSEPAVGDVTVEYRFLAGTAVIGDGTGRDAYAFSSGTSVTFAAGEQSKTVQYRIESDNTDEADETVVLEVYGADGAELAGGAPVLRATGWILDDDGSGNNLALYVSDPVLVEGDSGQRLARFEVSLSRPATAAFEVDYTTLDGTATAGEDYQAQSDTLSFAVGQQGPVAIDVPVFGDTEVEPSELFTLSVDKPAELAAATSGSAAILDDDAGGGQPTVSVSDTAQMEATANNDPNFLTWTISLSEPAVGDVTVEYRFLAGTAVIGDGTGRDAYAFSSGTSVTFAAGEQSKTVQYRIESDNTDEADETVVLEVYGADGAELAGGAPVLRATGWILDDDGSGNNLALYVSDPVLVEGDSGQRLARFEVSLSRPATAAFEVDYTTLDGTATAGEDYQAQSDTLSFAVGQQGPVAIDVPVFGDTEVEPSELFTLSVDKPAELAAATSGSAAILDDDAGGGQPTVSVSDTAQMEATANNDPNFLTWTISLSEPAVGDVTVEYRFLAGTAVIGDGTGRDAYAFSSGTSVTFAAGEQSKTVQYRIESDNTDEADETVVLEVYGADGAELAGGAPVLRATGWILDDDGSGNNLALYVSDPVLVEGDSGQRLARFEVSLSRPATAAFEVDYTTLDGTATAGEDYQAQSDTLSFAVGQQGPVAIDVPVFGDTEVEPSELFTLSVDKPAELAAATSGSAAILDDDAGGGQPTVSVSDTAQMEATANNDPNFLTWTISLSEPAVGDVTVEYRFLAGTAVIGDGTGRDAYAFSSGTSVTFAAGEQSKTVQYRIESDNTDEADETVVLEVYGADGAELAGGAPVLRATGWILDDDGSGNNLALYVSDPVLVEGDSGQRLARFEVSLSRPATAAFEVDYTTLDGTATAGEDYQAQSDTLSFAVGQQGPVAIDVPVFGDTEVEPSELFTLSVDKPAELAAATSGTATIENDDFQYPPEAADDAYDVTEGRTLSVDSARGVLANDTDVENDVLAASLVTGPERGTLTLNDNGSFSYTPVSGELGEDHFVYRAYDGEEFSEEARVTLNIREVPPVVSTGGSGSDRLLGADTNDTLDGDGGSDWINGGAGDDRLTGGTNTLLGTGALMNPLLNFGPGPAGGWSDQESAPRLVGDIDGDGAADIVGFGGQRTFTSLNDGAGGLSDLIGAVDNFAQAQKWLSQDGQTRLLGDADGDGDDDIIGFGINSGFVAFSNGDGTFSGFKRAVENFANAQGWRSDNDTPRVMGDVNGDGIDDIIGFGGKVTFTALGQGDGTFGNFGTAIENFSKAQGWASNDTFLRLAGDVNGDGLDDIVGFGVKATFTALSNGDGTFGGFQRGIDNFAQAQGWGDNDATPRLIGDVNGDGIADIVGFGGNTTFAALGVGDGTFGAIEAFSTDFNRAAGWTSQNALPRQLADIDGDGSDDIVGFSSKGVLTRLSTGESDLFVFEDGFGTDTITDFDVGLDGDRMNFRGLSGLNDLADVQAAASQDGADTVITDGADSIRLTGVTLGDLTEADFLFG